MKYTNSYEVTIDFKPWFDTGYVFTKLHMFEELGGQVAYGEIDMELDGSEAALDLITNQHTGTLTIEKEEGNIYNIDIFITSRKYFKNNASLSFICINNKNFFTELVSGEWTDITTALDALYPGKKDIRCESDINNGVTIFQNSESNYSLCKKLAYSFKHNTIFAFGWEGLLIKEIIGIDSGGNKEPYFTISGNVDLHQIDSYNFNYNKKLYHKPFNPWETLEDGTTAAYPELQAKNNRVVQFYNDYCIVGTDYYQLMDNYWFNLRYMNSDMYTSFRVVDLDMPKYKIGDVLTYKREEQESKYPFEYFLVRSNELFFAIDGSNETDSNGLNFSWTSKFIGLQENGSTLPETDPTNSTNTNS